MKKCPGQPFFNMVTPSDIAYVLAIIKNGKESWDQTKRLQCTPGATEKKIQPLFSRGDGKKRLSGNTVWNNAGMEFFYTAEKNWREIYNSNRYLKLINKWEKWEPADKTKKDSIKTIWEDDKEDEKKKRSDDDSVTKKEWWDTNVGYNENLGLKCEIRWDKNSEDSKNEGGGGDVTDQAKEGGERDMSNKTNEEVAEKDENKEDDEDGDKGGGNVRPRHSNRKY
jgi:hypothetical protein